jgi:hypothetical protein
MLRNAIVVCAIVLALGSSGLSDTAFARGGYGGGGGDGFPGNHFGGGFDVTPRDGHGGHDNRARDLRDGLRGYGGRDVWGHWGAYYGPMVPSIF